MQEQEYVEGRGYVRRYNTSFISSDGIRKPCVKTIYRKYPKPGRPWDAKWAPTEELVETIRQLKAQKLKVADIERQTGLKTWQYYAINRQIGLAN